MKKIIIISIFVLGMIIPNIDVKAVDVSNEEELRNALAQGGDITLTQNIEVTQPLVIDKDVNISGYSNYDYHSIMMQGNNTLLTVNSGNVYLDIKLYAGWNGKYYTDEYGTYPDNVVKGKGNALVVNGGNIYLDCSMIAGNVGLEVNGGTVTGEPYILAGDGKNYNTFLGGQGMIVNGGNIDLDYLNINSGGTALTVNKSSSITLNDENGGIEINSFEGNGLEVNDGAVVNINSTYDNSRIFGSKNAIYLNGGIANLSGKVGISSSTSGYGIYINKGINTNTNGNVLNLKNDFIFGYVKGATPNFNIYVNPDITELRVADEKEFLELSNNKLNLGFCGGYFEAMSQTEEERKDICTNLNSNYDGEVESNKLNKCAVVYINGEKQNEVDASCNPVNNNGETNEPSQIVNVPATSAYASIIIIVLGIICVIVSVIVTRKVTRKNN